MSGEPDKSALNSASEPASRRTAPEERSFLWLRRADQWLLGILLCVGTVLLGVHWVRINGWTARGEPVRVLTADGYFYTLDINHATWVEWAQLDGIGETLAKRIVQDRLDRGPFAEIDDVSRVRGIGQKTMDRIRPHLRNRNVFTVETGNRSEVENTP